MVEKYRYNNNGMPIENKTYSLTKQKQEIFALPPPPKKKEKENLTKHFNSYHFTTCI